LAVKIGVAAVAALAGWAGRRRLMGGPGATASGTERAGGVVEAFSADVLSSDHARLAMTLTRPSQILLIVREDSDSRAKVGRLSLGDRPGGRSVVDWDLRLGGSQLPGGNYRLVVRAGNRGRSRPVHITVPDPEQ
jgi:hypothetical protein